MRTDYFITDDGLTLIRRKFEASTPGTKKAFVAHSQNQHSLNLLPFLEALAKQGWNAQATDLRGHGHSASPRAPLAHMEMYKGWERLVEDLRQSMQDAFQDIPWASRLVIAPNIGASLVLEVLKTWPDLAKYIVFCAPPPAQPNLYKLGKTFAKARSLIHPQTTPDDLTKHQLYRFLGAQLKDQNHLIDVVSSDKTVTQALLVDPLSWPTPTTGYFYEMFRGMDKAWNWPEAARVREETRLLIIYGEEDPVTSNGKFLPSIIGKLNVAGIMDIKTNGVLEGRAGLIGDQKRFKLAELIADWTNNSNAHRYANGSNLLNDDMTMGRVSSDVLKKIGRSGGQQNLASDDFVELCYNAINDDSHWVEMLYRLAYSLSGDTPPSEGELEIMVSALMPHWDRSYAISRQIMQNAIVGTVLQSVIDYFQIGMAIVTDSYKIVYCNQAFTDNFQILLSQEKDPNAEQALIQIMAKTSLTENGEALIVINDVPIGYFLKPTALRQSALQQGGASGVVIIGGASHFANNHGQQIELLKLAYGFTPKEASVALHLMSGMAPGGIAETMHVSVHTVRSHLKQLFEKVNVGSQVEFIARLSGGPLQLFSRVIEDSA